MAVPLVTIHVVGGKLQDTLKSNRLLVEIVSAVAARYTITNASLQTTFQLEVGACVILVDFQNFRVKLIFVCIDPEADIVVLNEQRA